MPIFTFVRYCLIDCQNIWTNLLLPAIFLFIKQGTRANHTDNTGYRYVSTCRYKGMHVVPQILTFSSGSVLRPGTAGRTRYYVQGRDYKFPIAPHIRGVWRSMEESGSSNKASFAIIVSAFQV